MALIPQNLVKANQMICGSTNKDLALKRLGFKVTQIDKQETENPHICCGIFEAPGKLQAPCSMDKQSAKWMQVNTLNNHRSEVCSVIIY